VLGNKRTRFSFSAAKRFALVAKNCKMRCSAALGACIESLQKETNFLAEINAEIHFKNINGHKYTWIGVISRASVVRLT